MRTNNMNDDEKNPEAANVNDLCAAGSLPPFFYEIFDASLLRLGPGTEAATLRALDAVRAARPHPVLPPDRPDRGDRASPRVLDLGCGTGAQTLVLARRLGGQILAVDNHEPYLAAVRRRAADAGVADKIVTRLQDMRTFEPGAGAFDLIWSEGALFCMGFREGLTRCRAWLTDGGFLVVSELCWLRADPPGPCRRYLEGAYPAIIDVETNLAAMRDSGYTVVDHFTLPESAWRDEFYDPVESRVRMLRTRYAGDAERLRLIEIIQAEIDNYRTYSAWYGYVFCVLRR